MRRARGLPRVKGTLSSPARLLWWTLTLQLPRRLRLRAEKKLLVESRLFDHAFYLKENPDVAAAGIDPLLHYLIHGWREGRDPHPLFDTGFYLEQNPDVAAVGVNPLVHYLRWGMHEGRRPHAKTETRKGAGVKNTRHRVVFVSGEPETPGHQYRVRNVASSLPPRFFETITITSFRDIATDVRSYIGEHRLDLAGKVVARYGCTHNSRARGRCGHHLRHR